MVSTPCAACKLRRCKCSNDCVFAPYFPPEDPIRFAVIQRVFGASNVGKILSELPVEQRAAAVHSLVYEANCRLRCPVYGCVGVISALQQRLKKTRLALASAENELANCTAAVPGDPLTDFMAMPSSTPDAWNPPPGIPPVMPNDAQMLPLLSHAMMQAQWLTDSDIQRMNATFLNRGEQGMLGDYGTGNYVAVTGTRFDQMDRGQGMLGDYRTSNDVAVTGTGFNHMGRDHGMLGDYGTNNDVAVTASGFYQMNRGQGMLGDYGTGNDVAVTGATGFDQMNRGQGMLGDFGTSNDVAVTAGTGFDQMNRGQGMLGDFGTSNDEAVTAGTGFGQMNRGQGMLGDFGTSNDVAVTAGTGFDQMNRGFGQMNRGQGMLGDFGTSNDVAVTAGTGLGQMNRGQGMLGDFGTSNDVAVTAGTGLDQMGISGAGWASDPPRALGDAHQILQEPRQGHHQLHRHELLQTQLMLQPPTQQDEADGEYVEQPQDVVRHGDHGGSTS